MKLVKHLLLIVLSGISFSLLAQTPNWNSQPQDLDLICMDGVNHDAEIQAWLDAFGGGIYSPGCGNEIVTNDYAGLSPDCAGADSVQVSFIVTDDCMEADTAMAWIAILDTMPPVFDQMVSDVTVSCTDILPDLPAIDIMDTCDPMPMLDIEIINGKTNNGSCSDHTYTIERNWIATDACGNVDTLSQTIFVQDITPPTFTGPADLTLSCQDDTSPSATGQPTNIADDCSGGTSILLEEHIFLQGCVNQYTITRLWSVKDTCGNESAQHEQTILVQDFATPVFSNTAQDEIFDCSSPAAAELAFQAWLTDNGSAAATDNCTATNDLVWFAAVPGSYNLTNPNTWPGTSPGNLTPGTCQDNINGILRQETVDFVVYDECQRASLSTATFFVVDQTAPVFSYCPPDLTLTIDNSDCELNWTMLLPDIDETCDNSSDIYIGQTTGFITSDTPSEAVIVDPLTLSLSGLPVPPATASGTVSVDVELINVDGEGPTEFFNVYLSDGTLLGTTNATSAQCGGSTTSFNLTSAQMQLLTLDGNFSLELVPNIPSQGANFGINAICGTSTARMSVEFDYNFPTNFEITYELDGAAPEPLDYNNAPSFTLDEGNHTILFTATDCVGNISTCAHSVLVQDGFAPQMLCPDDVDYYLEATDDCNVGPLLTLPFPKSISEDCNFQYYAQTQPLTQAEALITFENDPDYLEYVAQEKSFTFSGVEANATGPQVLFTVEVNGDNQNADDYFLIFGDNGNIIGATRVGLPNVTFTPGACPSTAPSAIAEIWINVDVYNDWASDGIINITAVPNRNFNIAPPGIDGDGINPVCQTFPNGTPDGSNDGLSSIYVTLEMTTATLMYSVSGVTNVALSPVPLPQGVPSLNFGLGESTVTYSISDLEGNTTSCNFNVNVLDTISPIANCQATTIFINPSGFVDYILDPSEVDNNSTDNCGIMTYSVSPDNFTCADIGKDTLVTLTVTDASGNSSSCQSMVAIEGEKPAPEYSISLCGNDTLFLFANPPAAQGGVVYVYQWSGPNGFSSNLQNPEILNATAANSGSYTVEVEGITGCTTIGSVEVTLNADISQPTLSQPGLVCEGDNLTLFVNISDGQSYTWIAPDFSTQTTTTPFLLLANINPSSNGNWSVEVLRNGCVSPQADPVLINVEALPAVVAANDGPVCLGTSVQLSANDILGASYIWSGPNGFTSVIQHPMTDAAAGVYTVTATSVNGCSASSMTTVSTLELPSIDMIQISGADCVDGTSDIILTSTVSGGAGSYTYAWSGPVPTGTGPSVTLVNATADVNGEYQLIATDMNGCVSTPSSVNVAVTNIPITPVISGATSICQGADILLTATSYSGEASYTWFTSTDQFVTDNATLLLENVTDTTDLQVFVTIDGCNSLLSPVVQIPVNNVIDQPNISGTNEVCSGSSIQIETINIPGAIYSWTGPAGFTSSVYNPEISQSEIQNEGNYQVQIELNGCASPLSEFFFVEVNNLPPTPTALSGGDVCLDETGSQIAMSVSSATAIAGATYTWFNANSNQQIFNPISALNFSFEPDGSYEEGVSEFYVIAENEGCQSAQSIPIAISLFEIPTATAFAGDDFLLCDAMSVTLEADAPTIGQGMWMQSGGPADAEISDPLDHNTVLSNLQNGQTYTFDWILSNGACVAYDMASVNISYQSIPQANDDAVSVPFAGEESFNVKENDQIDVEFFIDVIEGPFEGSISEIVDGEFTYTASGNFAGDDYMVYQVCNQSCPDVCTEAQVDFTVGADATCDIPTIFTPNGDGVNEEFVVPCLASKDFPNNVVSIFNQYGDEVFGASPYQNNWRGTYNGEELPVGTYYFVIEFGNGQESTSGFIILER